MPDVVIGGSSLQVVITDFGDTDLDGVLDPAVVEQFRGPQGPAGPAGGALNFVQATPAATWSITHNLGRLPGVIVIIDGEQVLTDVEHSSINSLAIVFPSPTAGEAVLL